MTGPAPPGARRTEPERLDARGHDPAILADSLRHVQAVDRWLGGRAAVRRHLEHLLELDAAPAPIRVLDVGTGDGGVLRGIVDWLHAKGAPATGVGVELHPEVLAVARARRRPGDRVGLVQADGLRLPFPADAFDVVLCTLTLHHFDDGEASALLEEMGRVARLAVLVSDLRRHPLHHLGARLLAATVWRRNPITRHDGPLSVLRSFTASELAEIGRRAGLTGVVVRRHLLFRLVLEGRP